MGLGLAWLENRFGQATVDKALLHFTEEFLPVAVYQGKWMRLRT